MDPPSAFRRSPPQPPLAYRRNSIMVRLLSKHENSNTPITCSMKSPTNIDSLPNELLFGILVLLPADFLFENARLVCRRWARIIHSQDFIQEQTTRRSTTYGLLLSSHSQSPIYVTATKQGRIEVAKLSYVCRAQTQASCDGLTIESFLVNKHYGLPIINPSTKQPFFLPQPRERNVSLQHHGIAYSAASMEYKVAVPFVSRDYWLKFEKRVKGLGILTVGVDKSWRKLVVSHLPRHAKLLFQQLTPLTTEGFLHWARKRYCLTLNVETEIFTFSKIPLPHQQSERYKYNYLSTGRNLSLLIACGDISWEVWEMEPENGEWRKLLPHNIELKIELKAKECNHDRQLRYKSFKKFIRPIGWVKYLEILALSFPKRGHTCIIYNLDTHETNTIDLPYYYNCTVHRNTLEWLS